MRVDGSLALKQSDNKARMARANLRAEPPSVGPSEVDAMDLSPVLEAIGAAGMQDKEFAFNGGLDPAQWARIKGGVGNLHWKTVRRQPAKFWIALDAVQRRRLGISEHTEEQIHQEQINATADALWTRLVDCFRKGTENAE